MAKKTFTLGVSEIRIGEISRPLLADGTANSDWGIMNDTYTDPVTGNTVTRNANGMPSVMHTLGYTNEGSASLNFEEPEKTEFFAEEVDDPVLVFKKAGKITVDFDVMNPDVDTLQELMGGSARLNTTNAAATGTAENNVWLAPGTSVQVEKALRITPRQGFQIFIPRADITARMGDNLTKTELLVLHVSATVLAPEEELQRQGVAKIQLYRLP